MRKTGRKDGSGDPMNNLAGTVERVLIDHDFVCLILVFRSVAKFCHGSVIDSFNRKLFMIGGLGLRCVVGWFGLI